MKQLLLIAAFFISVSAFSQGRDIQFTLVKPANGLNIASATPFDVEYIITNVGTASTFVTDSIIIQYYIAYGSTITPVAISGQSPLVFTNKVMVANDTIWRKFKCTINSTGFPTGTPANFCARAFAQTAGKNIDSVTTNNSACVSATLPVHEVERPANNFNIFPNPASTEFTVLNNHGKACMVNIFDISGKLMKQVKSNAGETNVDVTVWPEGLYIYQIQDEDGRSLKSGKININR